MKMAVPQVLLSVKEVRPGASLSFFSRPFVHDLFSRPLRICQEEFRKHILGSNQEMSSKNRINNQDVTSRIRVGEETRGHPITLQRSDLDAES